MGIITVLAVAAIAAAATAGSAAAANNAQKKAQHAQNSALTGQKKILGEELSFNRLNQAATDADRLRAENRLKLQGEVDPELAQLRQLGKEKLLAEAQRPNASLESSQVAKTLFNENNPSDPRLQALKDSIINRAQADIAAGATLPPQFQADLVRAGVAQGSQAGFNTDARTVGGTISRALGIGGEQLKTARENQATNLAGAATGLEESRARILESIFPAVKQAEDTRKQQAAQEFGIGDTTLPESGLTGREAAAIQQNRGNTLLKIRGKRGDLSAQSKIDAGKAAGSYIGAGASFATSALGAYGGGGGGGGSGGGINYGSLLSSVQGSGGGGGGGGRSDLYNQYGPQ